MNETNIAEFVLNFVEFMLEHGLTPLQIVGEVTVCLRAVMDEDDESEEPEHE
jgi:hypothetical protein